MNTFILVGTVIDKTEIRETSSGNKYCELMVRERRPYRNADGDYDADVHEITLWKSLASEDYQIGQEIMIRGRIQSYDYVKDEKIYHNPELIAERVSQFVN